MKISLSPTHTPTTRGALVVSFFSGKKEHPELKSLARSDAAYVRSVMAHDLTVREELLRELHLPSNPDQIIILAHCGKKQEWTEKKLALFARKAVVFLKEHRIAEATLTLGDYETPRLPAITVIRLLAENFLLADFSFNKYKQTPEKGWPTLAALKLITPNAASKRISKALEEATVVGEETNHCRALANTPGGDMTPQTLAEAALAVGARHKIKVSVYEEEKLRELGMGGILGVSRGSAERPRLILMEYHKNGGAPLIFVGKGVTFDSGGLNLKPSNAIYEMHMDMAGGAAVIHAIAAIARLKLAVPIVGLIPAVENMPSGASYRPGDVLKTFSGKTVEVLNTDAEGRIVLADAIAYAHRFKPHLIVDVATLTGAAMIALGQRAIALFASSEKLEALARDVGNSSGDYVWPLPTWDEYKEDIKGTFGDIANTGKNRFGDAIAGAMFLKEFTEGTPWMHLDIAPTMTTIEGQYLAKGASGTGVRFLVELAKRNRSIPLR